MASGRAYLDYILEQLSDLREVSVRPMMGEFILYVGGKIVGGVYDDRLLVKNTPASQARMPEASLEAPYPGAKPMLAVEETDDAAFLCGLLQAIAEELR